MGRAKHGGALQNLKMSEESKQKHMRFVAVYIAGGLGCLACALVMIIAWVAGLTSSQLGSLAGISWCACPLRVVCLMRLRHLEMLRDAWQPLPPVSVFRG